MHDSVMDWGRRMITPLDVSGRDVLDVGSMDWSGSLRPVVEALGPASYVGIDIQEGPRVDLVLDVSNAEGRFGERSFDMVICTSVLEHVQDWHPALWTCCRLLRMGGILILSVPAPGFPYHEYPGDYWRWTPPQVRWALPEAMRVEDLTEDLEQPGVFCRARRMGHILPAPDKVGRADPVG